jgi:hypothetical protein
VIALGILARLILAFVGILVIRRAFYGRHWGHGRAARVSIQAAVGTALALPLWSGAPGGRPWLVALAVGVLLPWRALVVSFLSRRMREGLAMLALEWETELQEDPATGLLTVERGPSPERRAAWAGNVLVHVRSLHPGVSTGQDFFMMGFVVGLERPPSVVCSFTRGWAQPRYHLSEWRRNTTMQGQVVTMSLGDLLAEGGRDTGGALERLVHAPAVHDPRLSGFQAIGCDDLEAFARVFQDPLLDALGSSARGLQYECNVTPTSVNVFAPYCGPPQQRAHVAFLDALAAAVML